MSGGQRWGGQAALAALVALHLLLGLGFGLNAPLFESPDEPGHYLFVRYLQAYGRLPVQTAEFNSPRAHHPPGYYALAALLSGWVSVPGSPDAIQVQTNPKFGFRAADPGNDNKAVYLHNGPEERWPYQGQSLVVHLARLISLLFAMIAVVATYGAARELRPGDEVFGLLAAGLVAFNPMVLYMSGLVNNDTAALSAGAVTIYLVSRFARRGFTIWRWAIVGLVWGIGLMLKASALVLSAPIGLALMVEVWRVRSARRRLVGGIAVAAPAALIAGWWFVRNVALYGDPLANNVLLLVNGAVPASKQLADLPGKLTWFFQGLVGCGPVGPLSLCFQGWIYAAAAVVGLAGLAGVARLCARRWPPSARSWAGLRNLAQETSTVTWAAHALLIAGTFAAATSFSMNLKNGWQGRFMFPSYTSAALFLAAGLLAVVPVRWRPALAGTTVLACLALSAYALFGLLIPRYGIPPAPAPGDISRATPLEAQIGHVARVLAYRVEGGGSAHPGGVVAVTVYWQVMARTSQPYTVFIHVFSPDAGSVAQRDTYPGLGNYATTLWDPGRTFVDTYRLYLPPDAAVGPAIILLGLYDATSGQRLPVTGRDAGPAEDAWVQFGSVTIQ